MQRGSDKHGPLRDEQMEHEVQGLEKGEKSSHAEAWKDPEPSGEDQPDVDMVPDGTLSGGTPAGMSDADVEGRSNLAGYLGKSVYPAERDDLLRVAEDNNAPDAVLGELRALPEGTRFANVNEVWEALGRSTESQRF